MAQAPDKSLFFSDNRRTLIFFGLAVAPMFVLLYGVIPYTYSHLHWGSQQISVFHALWMMWEIFPDYQYGMVVPALVGFIIFRKRKELANLPVAGWGPGLVFVVGTLALYWAGRRVDNQYIGFFSIQFLLASLVLWILGRQWLLELAFPLLFLVFAWPMPFLDNLVTFPLRMLMSHISVFALNFLGLDAAQNGTGIFSAGNADLNLAPGALFQVDVADPCSGIRSLFALLMISALYGYFMLKSPWHRAILFVAAIPLAIIGNFARIVLLTLGIVVVGAPTAIGSMEKPSWFHEGAGYAVFLVAITGMMGVYRLLTLDRDTLLRNLKEARSAVEPAPLPARILLKKEDVY